MKKINESFICLGCGKNISPAEKTCRNHCPYCFTSLHVDDKTPGDRMSPCKNIMLPIEYFLKGGEIKILFICTKCKKKHRNKSATDDNISNLPNLIENNKKRIL